MRLWDADPMFAPPSCVRAFAPMACLTLAAVVSLSAQQPSVAPSATGTPTPAPTPAYAREVTDLPYVTGGTDHQRLDFYLPLETGGPPRPLVVWIHGGGWVNGTKTNGPSKPLVRAGFAAASLEYRFSKQAVFPAQIEDCKAAIRWIRAHAADYNIDPNHIGVWGASAGGHLVSLLGTLGHDRRFDVGENLDQSSAVQCVVDSCGPTDFLHWGDPPLPSHVETLNSVVNFLIGGKVETHQEQAKAASPITYVDKNSAPFLIQHGDIDPTVPLQQAQLFDAALRKAGVESTLVVFPDTKHNGPAYWSPETNKRVADFFNRHLGVKAPDAR